MIAHVGTGCGSRNRNGCTQGHAIVFLPIAGRVLVVQPTTTCVQRRDRKWFGFAFLPSQILVFYKINKPTPGVASLG
jgi:hypothetical protein